jgi:hypothetical protein
MNFIPHDVSSNAQRLLVQAPPMQGLTVFIHGPVLMNMQNKAFGNSDPSITERVQKKT